jgi:hypothetical protein
MQSEMALWGELGSKLATTRSATEAFDAYAKCVAQQMKMTAEDGQRMLKELQYVTQKVTQSLKKGVVQRIVSSTLDRARKKPQQRLEPRSSRCTARSVAPRAGAWIETTVSFCSSGRTRRRLPAPRVPTGASVLQFHTARAVGFCRCAEDAGNSVRGVMEGHNVFPRHR